MGATGSKGTPASSADGGAKRSRAQTAEYARVWQAWLTLMRAADVVFVPDTENAHRTCEHSEQG